MELIKSSWKASPLESSQSNFCFPFLTKCIEIFPVIIAVNKEKKTLFHSFFSPIYLYNKVWKVILYRRLHFKITPTNTANLEIEQANSLRALLYQIFYYVNPSHDGKWIKAKPSTISAIKNLYESSTGSLPSLFIW